MLADDEAAAKALVEADTSAHDLDTVFGEYVLRLYDYIQWSAEAKVRDQAAAALLAEIFHVPANVALPHVDAEVKSALGMVYLVRVAPERVVKLYAQSSSQGVEEGRRLRLPPG